MNVLNYVILAPAQAGNPLINLIPLLLIIVVFWFFMIRPQMKRQKELKNFRNALQKGDKIITNGGIYGKVIEINDTTILMEVEGGMRLKIDKFAVLKDPSDLGAQK